MIYFDLRRWFLETSAMFPRVDSLETGAPACDDGDWPSKSARASLPCYAAAFPSSSYRTDEYSQKPAARLRVDRLLLSLGFDPSLPSQLPPRQQHKKNRLPSLAPPRRNRRKQSER